MLRSAAPARAARAAGRAACGARRAASTESEVATAFRRFGHLRARIDPLGVLPTPPAPELDAAAAALPAVAARYAAAYCGALGAEFEHCETAEERAWWAERLEAAAHGAFDATLAQKKNAWALLEQAEQFELFLQRKFTSLKRYSGEGTESLLPAINEIFAQCAAHGVRDVVIGQAHRGRLGLLVSLLAYPVRKMLWKIFGNDDLPAAVQGLDDVSSHIAASVDRAYPGGSVHVSLLHNPSHLEFVNPVAAGKTRAKQAAGSADALCLLIHGDAAVSGQGIVAETYAMANLPGYSTGGTIHVITNNLVGFTAEGSSAGRSSRYASDMAKVVAAPVLHVNAESMRDVLLAAKLAVEYRARFSRDVVLDLIGFRKHGHNELDEPGFTSPALYRVVRATPSFPSRYAAQLEAEGVLAPGARAAMHAKLSAHLEAEYAAAAASNAAVSAGAGAAAGGFTADAGSLGLPAVAAAGGAPPPTGLVVGDGTAYAGRHWLGMTQASIADTLVSPPTGVPLEALRAVGAASVAVPPGVRVHERLLRSHVQPRLAALSGDAADAGVDWATAEALAFGSLLAEGHGVRLSGQDSQRGTFSHRHSVLHDQDSGATVTPLSAPLPAAARPAGAAGAPQGRFEPVSSLLSELAVVGFEYGVSWESPRDLVLWEAQFGDFSNCAASMVDAFVASGETKWLRSSGLVLLLPHGFDGAGPEHSSARIERYLGLVNSQAVARAGGARGFGAGDKALRESVNLLVANPTTPAQYFHLLRRQLARAWRKPLVVIAPKTLIRHPQALSALRDMAPGTAWAPVLPDALAPAPAQGAGAADEAVTRVLLVSGKLYYELAKRRAELLAAGGSGGGGAATAAATRMVRVEELSPFPTDALLAHVRAAYPRATSVSWVQEEPANAGAWAFAEAHLTPALAAAGLPPVTFIGRPALAAPSVGLGKYNARQQAALLAAAIPA